MDQDRQIRELLSKSRVIAVVGLSADADKPSNGVARYLMSKGYRIIPVNPGQEMILGEKSYASLSDIKENVDIVDIFMRAEKVLPFVRDALLLRPKAIWLQLGIVSHEAKALADADGTMFVMDKCVKQEHSRLFPKQP
jgi:predicted CoA-binding protein